jgi:DNA topoisomerase-3
MGWKIVYNKEETNQSLINKIQEGLNVTDYKINYKEHKTTPPDRYNEATLLYAMEHAGKYTSNKEEQLALEESSGIGTPATRADIIERIFSAGYVKLVGKSIHPTEKGMQLIDLVPEALRKVSLTAKQELSLDKISKGKMNKDGFIKEIVSFTKTLTDEVLNSSSKFKHDNMTAKKCPDCGKALLDITNKFGKVLACIDKECGYKKNVYKISNLRCPTCHHQLKQIGDKETGFVQCDCGFKEKCESYFNHLKDSKQGMNKKDLRKYIDKQEKEVPKNNPFADLFKNE